MDPTLLPSLLMAHLNVEGSDLMIQKAGTDNLDWTWRVTYCNGSTRQSTTITGADLSEILGQFGHNEFGDTWSRS